MRTIKLSDIVISENRQRQEFDPTALQELKNSIEDRGLMQAPVLRWESTGAGSGRHILVAGERRLRAIKEIFDLGGKFDCDMEEFDAARGEVPYCILGDLSPLEAEEAELDENLRRRDLTWQELAAAHSRLHTLRGKQAALAEETAENAGIPVSANPTGYTQTIADTAQEIHGRSDGYYQDQVRKEIIVAKNLDNPAIAGAKDLNEAFKLLKKDEQRKSNIELARTVGASFSAASHRILNMDCLEFMRDPANAGQFDVILTDPPYGMAAHEFGDGAGRLTGIEHHYDDSFEAWHALMQSWTVASFKVCKPQAHAYVFCDIDNFHELKALMQKAGWYVFRTPLIVHKTNSGRVPLPDRGPRRQYETILYAIKGNKPVTHIYPDVIPVSGDSNLSHGAQKPVALYENLLQRSVRPGDCVLDSFAGTGTLLPAAHTFKCAATVIEKAPEYYALCLKRAQGLDKQQDLLHDLEAP